MRSLRELIGTISSGVSLSEGLQHHVVSETPIVDPVYRPGSAKFFELIREARHAWARGDIDSTLIDPWVMSTDLGEFGIYEGR